MTEKPIKTGAKLRIDFGRMPGPGTITVDDKEIEGFFVDDIRIGWPSADSRRAEIRIHGMIAGEDGKPATEFVQQGAFIDESEVEEFLAWRAQRKRGEA